MRAVVQRVSEARVMVQEKVVGAIDRGILVLLGINQEDTSREVEYLVDKVLNLRIFPDGQGVMNRSLLEEQGELLVVSQFTLIGDCRKGRRPSYNRAAPPATAQQLYQCFVESAARSGLRVATGEFQAMMQVSLVNDGPVTLLLDSEKNF